MKRAMFNVLAVFLVFLFPWWISVAYCLVGMVLFSSYFEIILIGIIIDLLYGAPIERFNYYQYTVSTVLLVLYACFELVRDRIRFLPKN